MALLVAFVMSFGFAGTLTADYSRLFTTKEDYDVIIDVGEGSDKGECRAHSIILKTRCEYFRIALSSNWAKKDGNYYKYSKPNVTSRAFDVVLKYVEECLFFPL